MYLTHKLLAILRLLLWPGPAHEEEGRQRNAALSRNLELIAMNILQQYLLKEVKERACETSQPQIMLDLERRSEIN
jgi:hypothetical protein